MSSVTCLRLVFRAICRRLSCIKFQDFTRFLAEELNNLRFCDVISFYDFPKFNITLQSSIIYYWFMWCLELYSSSDVRTRVFETVGLDDFSNLLIDTSRRQLIVGARQVSIIFADWRFVNNVHCETFRVDHIGGGEGVNDSAWHHARSRVKGRGECPTRPRNCDCITCIYVCFQLDPTDHVDPKNHNSGAYLATISIWGHFNSGTCNSIYHAWYVDGITETYSQES